jgi:hypothetical protein
MSDQSRILTPLKEMPTVVFHSIPPPPLPTDYVTKPKAFVTNKVYHLNGKTGGNTSKLCWSIWRMMWVGVSV